MDIWETDKLLIFIGFVIPGFVSLKIYGLLQPSAPKESVNQLIDAISYSCINYALLFFPIYMVEKCQIQSAFPISYILFYAFVLFGAPVIWPFILMNLRTTKFFQRAMPHPTEKPWDYVFGQLKPYWVIVTLTDGKKIAGKYCTSSFASSSPAPEQLYLEEAWTMNDEGGFERKRTQTAGIMILSPDIATIEFFEITYGDNHDRQEGTR